jgi:hypothetical protein
MIGLINRMGLFAPIDVVDGVEVVLRAKRNREFADSPLEESGFELPVPCRRKSAAPCPSVG